MLKLTASRLSDSVTSLSRELADLQVIQAGIQEALNRSGHEELRRVDLNCEGNVVTISGRVPTFYLKQLAQSIVLSAPGVGRVNNEVRVC